MRSGNFSTLSSKSDSPAPSHTASAGGIPDCARAMAVASNDSAGVKPAIGQTPITENSRAKRPGRKGHTKSRVGCFNCKKARIKCKENRPLCDYCNHRGLKCEWPSLQINQMSQVGALIQKPRPNANAIPTTIQTQGPVFTMQDFRLFNHFIQAAYPHHPPENDSVWTHEIPSIASDYDYLLHSMLALSASDIAQSNPSGSGAELECVAISHRIKAIASLNQAIGKPITSVEQGNAMIATCMSLVFQSTLLSDGLVEYMTFVRGVIVVSIHMGLNNIDFLFEHMFDQAEVVASQLTQSRLIEPEHAHCACRSLELLGPLIHNAREKELHGNLLSAARALFTSSKDAYSHLAKIYALFSYSMSHEEFALYIDPSNEAGKLLQAHFSALQLIMTPFTRRETVANKRKCATSMYRQDGTTVRWLVSLHRKIKPEMAMYYEWPMWVQKEVEAQRITLCWEDTDTP